MLRVLFTAKAPRALGTLVLTVARVVCSYLCDQGSNKSRSGVGAVLSPIGNMLQRQTVSPHSVRSDATPRHRNRNRNRHLHPPSRCTICTGPRSNKPHPRCGRTLTLRTTNDDRGRQRTCCAVANHLAALISGHQPVSMSCRRFHGEVQGGQGPREGALFSMMTRSARVS